MGNNFLAVFFEKIKEYAEVHELPEEIRKNIIGTVPDESLHLDINKKGTYNG